MNKDKTEIQSMIANFCLMDDDFAKKCFESECGLAKLILEVILERSCEAIKESHTQVWIENPGRKSLCLDVQIQDEQCTIYNIELQLDRRGAGRKRARYHASTLDANQLGKGESTECLNDVYVIFISKDDVIGQGKASYHINRTIAETGEDFGDGSHIIYVNGSYRGDDPIGKLMHDLHCQNPDEMYYEELARITRYYKENKEGNDKMCQAMEEFEQRAIQKGIVVGRKEGIKEGKREGITEIVKRMLASKNFTFEQISQLAGITIGEISKIAQEMKAAERVFA